MRLLLLNQFDPASGAPTGRILADLGAELQKHGHEVRLIATGSSYGRPRRGLMRLLQEGWSHLSLLGRCLAQPRADAVISLTSPACLAVTAAVAARIHRAEHFHWVMDLYPETGLRLGELRDGALARLLTALMRRAYRGASRVVVLDEDMRDLLRTEYGLDAAVIAPFPPEVVWPAIEENAPASARWLYSGNFGRAHEIEVLLQVQKKLENRQVQAELILQGQGPQFLSSREAARRHGLRRAHWRAPVPLEELGASLARADVLVVTRRADMKGLVLPSKLILAEISGRRILWIGDTDGKTAQRLAREGHGVFAVDEVESIADWLEQVFKGESPGPEVRPEATSLARRRAVGRWEELLPRGCPARREEGD